MRDVSLFGNGTFLDRYELSQTVASVRLIDILLSEIRDFKVETQSRTVRCSDAGHLRRSRPAPSVTIAPPQEPILDRPRAAPIMLSPRNHLRRSWSQENLAQIGQALKQINLSRSIIGCSRRSAPHQTTISSTISFNPQGVPPSSGNK
jgi:hypothetical protein